MNSETTDNISKWKKFEILASEIQKELSPDAEVNHNIKIKGEDSKVDRQIDILVKKQVGQYPLLIVMQCKDERAPLDVNAVGEFASVISDVRANKGALVSSSGFTPAAINLAKQKGIDVFRLVDLQNKNWKSYASLPAAAVFDKVEGYRLKFAVNPDFPPERFSIPMKILEDVPNIILYRENGDKIDSIINLIQKAWKNEKLPRGNGENFDLEFLEEPVFIKDGESFSPVKITIYIKTSRKIVFGNIPLQSMRGFQDVVKGGIYTHSFTTEMISVDVVKKEWQVVESLNQLAISPVITLYSSNF